MSTTLTFSRFRGVFVTIVMIVGGTPSLGDQVNERTKVLGNEARTLWKENESLKKQYELASGDSFYLLVDPYDAKMTLAYRGVVLRRYSIREVRLADLRIACVGSNIRRQWTGIIWSDGSLDPQRPSDRVVLPVSDARVASEPPPPPSDTIPSVPTTYLLRYEPDLVVEIQRSSPDREAGWSDWLTKGRIHGREALLALSPSERKVIRLRIVLTSDDADSLYRSLPPKTKLLIVADRTFSHLSYRIQSGANGRL